MVLIGSSSAIANQRIKNCYNCNYKKTVVQRYYNNPTIVVPGPVPALLPGPTIVEAPAAYPVAPVYCAWYLDPYTFLGEIFGYDYIPICQ